MISEKIFVEMQVSHWITALALIGYLCILYGWLKKTGRRQKVGLVKPSITPLRECNYGLPLFALPILNCMIVQQLIWDVSYMMLMVCVAVIEEVFFRGFLYDILSKWNRWGYIFLSAFLFGVFHIVNLWEGYRLHYVIMQTVCAFSAGICYAGLTVKIQSIVPAIIAHSLTNLSASINGHVLLEKLPSASNEVICNHKEIVHIDCQCWFISVVYLFVV